MDETEGDVLPDPERVEQRRALEQHAELAQHHVARMAVKMRHQLAVDENLAGIGAQNAEHAFDHHRFAGAGPADHHQRLAVVDLEIDAVEHHFAPNRFLTPFSSTFAVEAALAISDL